MSARMYAVLPSIMIALGAGQPGHAQTTGNCTAIAPQSYLPVVGSSFFSQDQYSRYLMANWTWGSAQNMEWFLRPYAPGVTWSAGTYEHQHIFYNYDGLAYGNAPPAGYWDSNLPSPYVDTQIFDSANEKNVTIGSAHARGFETSPAGTWRYTTRFTSGGGSSSLVKIQAQRGLRTPTGCYTTYCSFGCDSQANYINLVPFQSGLRAPGRICWRWSTSGSEYWAC